jgi:ribosome biogenesis GTPase A
MGIKWYPGHMGKAVEKMAEAIRKIDVIIEVLDARLPLSSSNHQLEDIRRGKPCVKILNKHDLADPVVTRAWVRYFEREVGVLALPMLARQFSETKQLLKLCQRLAPNRGRPGFPVRVMVFGIPNVGKSTLINTLAGKSIAKVGDKPAITMNAQQVDLKNGMILSDTPGVLWPDMDDEAAGYRLAASGAIGASALDYTVVGLFAAEYMLGRYPELLKKRYELSELPPGPNELLDAVGRRLGCLMAGGEINVHRAAEAFLRELRAAKIGRVSLEEPPQPAEPVTSDADVTDSSAVPAVEQVNP